MNLSDQLLDILQEVYPQLKQISEADAKHVSAPGKWSKIQVLGHLVDSAINNIARVIRAQQTDDLIIEPYAQEHWVLAQDYANANWEHIRALFLSLNHQFARVIVQIPDHIMYMPREKHNLTPPFYTEWPTDGIPTLDFWISDYICHMENHLRQILPDYEPSMLDY